MRSDGRDLARSAPALRVGLLGCGRIASLVHGPVLAELEGVVVTALADADPTGRRRLGRVLPGAVHYADWRTPIELGEVDAVVICLPPSLHAPAAIAAFEAGCHAYVEKPLALAPDEARAMIAARDLAGTVGMVGLNFRFHPLIEDARARIASGELGEVLALRTLFTSARRTLPGWKALPGAGGDALADLGTHHLDLVEHLAASPVRLGSLHVEQSQRPEGTMAMVTARTEGGAHVAITVSQLTGTSGQWIEVLGETGHLSIDFADAAPRAVARPPGRLARVRRLGERLGALAPAAILRNPGRDPSFRRALARFADAARGRAPAEPGLEAGLHVLELVERASRIEGRAQAWTP